MHMYSDYLYRYVHIWQAWIQLLHIPVCTYMNRRGSNDYMYRYVHICTCVKGVGEWRNEWRTHRSLCSSVNFPIHVGVKLTTEAVFLGWAYLTSHALCLLFRICLDFQMWISVNSLLRTSHNISWSRYYACSVVQRQRHLWRKMTCFYSARLFIHSFYSGVKYYRMSWL